MGTLSAQLLIQFYTNHFLILAIFSIVWRCASAFDIILALKFVTFFYFVNFITFRPQMYRQGYLVIATRHTILYWSFWNFTHVFSSRVYRCASGLDIFIFLIYCCHFFPFHFFLTSDLVKAYRLWVPFERNFSCIIWEYACAFDEILILMSSTWNKQYCAGGGGGGRHYFTEVRYFLLWWFNIAAVDQNRHQCKPCRWDVSLGYTLIPIHVIIYPYACFQLCIYPILTFTLLRASSIDWPIYENWLWHFMQIVS